jgi:hypothetical protein
MFNKGVFMKTLLRSILVLLCLSSFVFGQAKVGTTAAPFLGISVGPHASSMGGAFVALGNDATALYWNPGAASRMGVSQFVAARTNWLAGTTFNWLGLVLNFDGQNALGLHFTQLDYGEENVTSVTAPEGTGERWAAQDLAIGLSYCRNLTDRFSIGGSVKYVQQKIWNETASAFALDVGLLFITEFNDLRLGMSISNFGTDMTLDGKDLLHRIDLDPNAQGTNKTIVAKLKVDDWPLPLLFRVGVAMDVVKSGDFVLTLAADALRPSDNKESINVGGEIAWSDMVFLRGGYKSLLRTDSEEGLTAGIGVKYNIFGKTFINADYTYAKFGLFKDVQMFGVGVTF